MKSHAPRARLIALGLVVWLACFMPYPVAHGQAVLSEAQAKAGFVLNFARYVEWPASAFTAKDAPVVACVQGRESVAKALSALESRPVQGRALRVRRVDGGADELRGCHVLFIGETDERRATLQLRAAQGQPILTIGDADRFIDLGGAIGLVYVDERLQFEINRQALEQQQLKASANLLRLARNAP